MLINTQMHLPSDAVGGPLLNAAGEFIGVNTINVHGPGSEDRNADEGHALPVGVVRIFLKVSKAYPSSEQNWIGLAARQLLPQEKDAVSKTLGARAGLYVDFVWDEGPAGESPIRAGDILVKMNGVALQDSYQLDKLLRDAQIGSLAEFFVLREDRGFISHLEIRKRPAWAGYAP
jgi:serine protease Do